MPDLNLGKLPDRTPVRITITVSPDLNRALSDYAAIYRETYGEAESVANLIRYMLEAFLDSDRGFARARRERSPAKGRGEEARRRSRPPHGSPPIPSSTTGTEQ